MSQPGPSKLLSSPRSRPSSPAEDRSFLNRAVSFEEDDSTSQNPEEYYRYEPYDLRPEFRANQDDLDELLNEDDIQHLKDWIEHVFSKLSGYDYYTYELVELITQNDPNTFITIDEKPSVIVTGIKKVIRSLQDKFRQFDLGVHEISTLAGSKLGARIEAAAEKASKILEETERENDILRETIKNGAFEREELKNRLNEALSYVQVLKKQGIFGTPTKEIYFLEDLLYRESKKGELESSFLDDVSRLNKALQHAERAKLNAEKEKMDVIAELKKDTELGGGIKSALLKKIKTIEADDQICKEAVDEWMKSIEKTVEEKHDEIERIKDMAKSVDDEIEYLKQELEKSTLERNELDYQITVCQEAVQVKFNELVECEDQVKVMKEYIEELKQQYGAFSNEAEKIKQSVNYQNIMDRSRSPTPSGSPAYMDHSGSSYAESMGSPNMQHIIHSPNIERTSSPISPPSPETPESTSPSPSQVPYIVVSPPPSEYHRNTDFRQNGSPIASEAQPSSDFPGSAAPINPSTHSLVRNRFDIGQNFNMRTVHSGTPSPYHQVTRLESSQPASGLSPMIDSPVRIQHALSHTQPGFVTPFVSTTRYGYTDPTAKCLNLPPGDDLDIGSSLRKTLLLTSSRRENPLIVNIDVQPQPLTKTADGEKFVCDISLDLQETNKPPLERTFTYGVPPAVTPTTNRRHGQFTPRSIFKKRHYNIRRLFGPQYKSPDMPSKWSPHYLPFDSRSPVTSFPPSPYYSDRSISWERSYDNHNESMMNTTYDPQSEKFEGPRTAKVHKKFDEYQSPIIKGPRRRYPTPVFSDEPYDIDTSSPVIKGPSYRSHMYRHSALSESPLTESDNTFGSASPVIEGGYYIPHSPIHDRTFGSNQSSPRRDFDRSSTRDSFLDRESSGLDGSYGRSDTRDSFLDRTSPGIDGSYDKSFSSRSDKSFNQSLSPKQDGTFDRNYSPRSDKSFNQSLSPPRQGGAFNRTFSPRSDKSFNQSMSPPRQGGAFDRTFSPRSDKTFNQSLSPHRQGGAFNRTFSPRSDKSFNQSMSPPRQGNAFDETFSTRSDKSFNQSLSPPRQGGAFDRSFSPRSDKSFNQSMSPTRSPHQYANTMHNETHSSRANETFDNISPQKSDTSDENNVRDSPIQHLKGPKQDDSN